MKRKVLVSVAIAGIAMFFASAGWADVPAPPVNQTLGMPDILTGELEEADCRMCHDSGVPDRHHLLYGQSIPAGSLVPWPDADGDGNPDTIYGCLNCHDENFTVVRDCLACHNAGSPHHTVQDAVELHCTACHGDFVDDYDDGHYIPTYDPSLVTPYRGLNGDGYENAPWPTPDLASDGSGTVLPAHFTETEAGPPFFTQTTIGPLGTTHTRNEPNRLKFKPADPNNDIFIGSTHHGGEQYSVVITEAPLGASWDDASQTLSFSVPTGGATAIDVVNAINAAAGTTDPDIEAELGYDGDDAEADLLAPEHYEPLGGLPPNSRDFGAGSCSYCHDTDGTLDPNGDPAGIIWDNHTLHHDIGLPMYVSDGAGGTMRRCDACHAPDYHDQSGPTFNISIRTCERCHGPDSLHNIQADSNGDASIVVGGEDAGYGHVGRDAGPNDSDCWGCHGFASPIAAVAFAPGSGPIIPTVHSSDLKAIDGGIDTVVTLTGSSFTNVADGTQYTSDVALTAADGSSVILTPDVVDEGALGVTIPGDTPAGNYNLQAVKSGSASNPAVISIKPEVIITEATAGRTVTINGSGFGGYAAGSGTSVTGTVTTGKGRWKTTTTVEAAIVSWSDTTIEADFGSIPNEVTVNSVFGSAAAEVSKGKKPKNRLPKR